MFSLNPQKNSTFPGARRRPGTCLGPARINSQQRTTGGKNQPISGTITTAREPSVDSRRRHQQRPILLLLVRPEAGLQTAVLLDERHILVAAKAE